MLAFLSLSIFIKVLFCSTYNAHILKRTEESTATRSNHLIICEWGSGKAAHSPWHWQDLVTTEASNTLCWHTWPSQLPIQQWRETENRGHVQIRTRLRQPDHGRQI